MKNLEKVFGYAAAFLLLIAFYFKFSHYPGAGVLILSSMFLYILGFGPIWFARIFKDATTSLKKAHALIAFLLFTFLAISFLFKVNHYPYAMLMVDISFVLFLLLIPILILTAQSKSDEISKSKYHSGVALYIFVGILAFFPALMNPSKPADQLTMDDVVVENANAKTLYLGVDNPIKVAIIGLKSENISLTISNGIAVGTNGKYNILPKDTGNNEIGIYFKDLLIGKLQYEVKLK